MRGLCATGCKKLTVLAGGVASSLHLSMGHTYLGRGRLARDLLIDWSIIFNALPCFVGYRRLHLLGSRLMGAFLLSGSWASTLRWTTMLAYLVQLSSTLPT